MAHDDHYLMMALLSALFGLAVVMIGGSAHPPHVGVLLAGAPPLLAGAYGTIFFWARGHFRD